MIIRIISGPIRKTQKNVLLLGPRQVGKATLISSLKPGYFEILEDTLVGQRLFPFEPLTTQKDLIRHPKFYFFDTGVLNSLVGNFVASSDRIGNLAEQLVMNQLLHSAWV